MAGAGTDTGTAGGLAGGGLGGGALTGSDIAATATKTAGQTGQAAAAAAGGAALGRQGAAQLGVVAVGAGRGRGGSAGNVGALQQQQGRCVASPKSICRLMTKLLACLPCLAGWLALHLQASTHAS